MDARPTIGRRRPFVEHEFRARRTLVQDAFENVFAAAKTEDPRLQLRPIVACANWFKHNPSCGNQGGAEVYAIQAVSAARAAATSSCICRCIDCEICEMSFLAQSLDEVHGDVADRRCRGRNRRSALRAARCRRRSSAAFRRSRRRRAVRSTEPAHARSEDAVDRRVQPSSDSRWPSGNRAACRARVRARRGPISSSRGRACRAPSQGRRVAALRESPCC